MPVIVRPHGDKYRSLGLRRYGLFFLDQLKHDMSFNNLEQGLSERSLPDGTRFVLMSVMGTDWVDIYTPVIGGGEVTTVETQEDVWITYNTPTRGGAYDIPTAEAITNYRQGIPTQTWTPGGAWNPGSLEGDPLIYYYPHTILASNDSRFNVLKSWTYNLQTKPATNGEWVASESITIFHRKSVSFNDVNHSIDDGLFWDASFGESIDVYHSVGGTASVNIHSDLECSMNFFVHDNGDFSIVKLKPYLEVDNVHLKYKLTLTKCDKTGAVLATNDYYSDPTEGTLIATGEPEKFGIRSVAYDGADLYCTVSNGSTSDPTFSEAFIHVSTSTLYDYDPVNQEMVSLAKDGYTDPDTSPDSFYLGVVAWHDFAKDEWKCVDIECDNDGGGKTFTYKEAAATTIFTQYSSSPMSAETLAAIDALFDGGTIFKVFYPLFPDHPSPWSAHYTVGGYSTQVGNDITAVFSQRYLVKPDASTSIVNYYRPFMHWDAIASWTPPVVMPNVPGNCAKWTTNGLVLGVEKITTTTTTA